MVTLAEPHEIEMQNTYNVVSYPCTWKKKVKNIE